MTFLWKHHALRAIDGCVFEGSHFDMSANQAERYSQAARRLSGRSPAAQVRSRHAESENPNDWGVEMSIKSDADLRGLEEVSQIVRLTLERLRQLTRPGISTSKLDDVAAELFGIHDATSAPSVTYGMELKPAATWKLRTSGDSPSR